LLSVQSISTILRSIIAAPARKRIPPVQGQQFSLLKDSQPQQVSIRNLLVNCNSGGEGLGCLNKTNLVAQNRCEGWATLAFSRLMASFALSALGENAGFDTIRAKPA
jgi:hypothetical protein